MDLTALHQRSAVEPLALFLRDGPLVEDARALGVDTELMLVPRMLNVLAAERAKRSLAQWLVARGAELVHSMTAWGHGYAGAAASIARIPAVWFQHAVPNWRRPENILASLTPARRILANSVLTANAQHRFNPRRIKIEVVQPGTRIPDEPRPGRRARGRAALGLGGDAFLVGTVAPLARGNGQPTLLRAAQSLCAARADARVIVAGGPPFGPDPGYPDELERLAASLGIGERVRFVGEIEKTGDLISALDVVVHVPDGPESFALAVIEEMACGTAVVAADAGAVREIVEPGVTALLLPPGNHEALATALLALHDDSETRERIASAGAEAARTRFDARLMTNRIESIYRDAVA